MYSSDSLPSVSRSAPTSDPALFNIVQLHGDVGGVHTQFPEIRAAMKLLEDAESMLPRLAVEMANSNKPDVFTWLQAAFGFQDDSVKNQREHLVMLLAGMDARMRDSSKDPSFVSGGPNIISSKTVEALLEKLTGNYKHWCNFHQLPSSISLPNDQGEALHARVVYIALWLLIWGEAANVRFMPECLCYIYHEMAKDPGLGFGEAPLGGERFLVTNFLKQVIVPIYDVIAKEARNSSLGDHAKWRNYDDLNEFFWSKRCHNLGWPMDQTNHFFGIITPATSVGQEKVSLLHRRRPPIERERSIPASRPQPEETLIATKENWVEVRTVLQIVRSFERIWIFYILLFQALLITAWHSPPWTRIFTESNLRLQMLSLSITYAGCRVVTAVIDLLLSWGLWRTMIESEKVTADIARFFYHAVFFIALLYTYNGF